MRIYSADETKAGLPFDKLIDALDAAFRTDVEAPLRHHHHIGLDGTKDATLLLMPAWDAVGLGGVKIVNVNPGNGDLGLPALNSAYLLFDTRSGEHLAIMDGGTITARRTAAASALGARYLARDNASSLLIVGAGKVAANLAYAMKEVRPINCIQIWNITSDAAETLAEQLRQDGFDAAATEDLESAVGVADIITCATLATKPIIKGAWLKPGQHVDLIGSFTPKMREADDEAIRRARVFVDVYGALKESGDIIDPIASGALTKDKICADLAALCRRQTGGRVGSDEITLFKGVGTALEDLASAGLVYGRQKV